MTSPEPKSAIIGCYRPSGSVLCDFFSFSKFSKFEGSRVDSNLRPRSAIEIGSFLKLVACKSQWLLWFFSKWTSQLVLPSSDLALMDRWNVHQRIDRVFAETIDSSFTLRGKHSNSSSKLSCVSLLKHKDGTRTIEMILKSTVLRLEKFPGLIRGVLPTILVVRSRAPISPKQHGVFLVDTCYTWQQKAGCPDFKSHNFLGRNGSRRVLQTLHSRRYFTPSSGILGKVFN